MSGPSLVQPLLPGLSWRRRAGLAAPGLAVTSLGAAVLEAVVLDVSIVSPADLVADVARLQVPWVLAQVLLVVGQELLLAVVLGLAEVLGPQGVLVRVQLAAAGALFVLSGIFHGVFGWHVAALDVLVGADRASAVHLAEILHALGDTTYYLGVASTALAMLALAPLVRRTGVLPSRLATLGVVAAVLQLVEFGYFLLPGLAWAAPVGVLLQAAWYVCLGSVLRRASWAPTLSGSGPRG